MRVKLKHRRLAEELARSPISLNRWAQRMGLRSGHLSELVNGKRLYPRPATRQKILAALDLGFEDLFELEMPRPKGRPAGRSASSKRPQAGSGSRSEAKRPSPAEAHRREESRAIRGGDSVLSILAQEIRYAFRQIRRRPAFAAAAILSLAIGIGANTALFSFVNALLWKPFEYAEPSKLLYLRNSSPRGLSNLSYPDYADLRDMNQVLSDVAVFDWEPFGLSGGDEAIRIGGGMTTASLFPMLGVKPLMGRWFTEEEDRPGAAPVVILGEELWRTYFGAAPDILGREVYVNSQPHQVIGVMPMSLDVPQGAKLWVPLALDRNRSRRGAHWLLSLGRLRPGTSREEAQTALEQIGQRLAEQHPDTNEGRSFYLEPMRERLVGPIRLISMALLGVSAFVLLIVCANVANLLLARGIAREREVAIRQAMGAGRWTVLRQLLTESVLLALIGGALGLVTGYWGVRALLTLPPVEIPPWMHVQLDWNMAAFALAASLLAAVVFGLAPALQASHRQLTLSMREGGRSQSSSHTRKRLRSSLAVAQAALAAVLLIGAGLMAQSLQGFSQVEPGFEEERALTSGMDLLGETGRSREVRLAAFERYQARLQALPGVEAVGATNYLPLRNRSSRVSFQLQGQTAEDVRANPSTLYVVANPDYFKAMGIPMLQGSTLPQYDAQAPSVVVSQEFARQMFPGENPLGKRLRLVIDPDGIWSQVVGVVGDIRHTAIEDPPIPMIYVHYQSSPFRRMYWVLRTNGDPLQAAPALRAAIAEIDPNQPLHEVITLSEVVDQSFWQWRFFGFLFWLFAAVALVLASIGLYGVMAYSVNERRQEMGIRLALGASREQVVGFVLKQGFGLVVIGLATGLAAGLGVGRLLSRTLYEVRTFEPIVFISAAVVLAMVAALAILQPARRASRVDPAAALKSE